MNIVHENKKYVVERKVRQDGEIRYHVWLKISENCPLFSVVEFKTLGQVMRYVRFGE